MFKIHYNLHHYNYGVNHKFHYLAFTCSKITKAQGMQLQTIVFLILWVYFQFVMSVRTSKATPFQRIRIICLHPKHSIIDQNVHWLNRSDYDVSYSQSDLCVSFVPFPVSSVFIPCMKLDYLTDKPKVPRRGFKLYSSQTIYRCTEQGGKENINFAA